MTSPPPEIIDAANLINEWMQRHGYKNWALGNICDRSFAERCDIVGGFEKAHFASGYFLSNCERDIAEYFYRSGREMGG